MIMLASINIMLNENSPSMFLVAAQVFKESLAKIPQGINLGIANYPEDLLTVTISLSQRRCFNTANRKLPYGPLIGDSKVFIDIRIDGDYFVTSKKRLTGTTTPVMSGTMADPDWLHAILDSLMIARKPLRRVTIVPDKAES